MTRQLSFNGVTFDIKELPLTKDFIDMYDASVKLVSNDERLFLIPRSIISRGYNIQLTIFYLIKYCKYKFASRFWAVKQHLIKFYLIYTVC